MSDNVNGARTVLVVDDYPSVLAWASRSFSRAGWQVLTANCSAEAVEAWKSAERSGSRVHLLVTDLELPDQDGASLARALRTLDPSLFVIGITGHADRGAEWTGALLHRTAFFRKPMLASELLSAANACTDDSTATDQELCPVEPTGESTV